MNEKALKLIQPVSNRDQVVASFKDAILSGTIQPGASIVEGRVAEQLGAGIRLSGAKLCALMQDSIADWRTEVFNAALPRDND